MSTGATAFTVTEIASATTTSYVCHAMNMLSKMLGQWNQIWMAFREVLSNRTSCDPTVTKSAMIGNLVDQSRVQQTWDRLVAQMHFEIWSVDDRYDRLLEQDQSEDMMFVDMVTKLVKINGDM